VISRIATRCALVPLLAIVVACESESVLPIDDNPGETGQLVIDATSSTDFSFIDLDHPAVVTIGDPESDTSWELALRRYEVRINGGHGGPGDVEAAIVVDHSREPAATLLGYTPENRLTEFESIDAGDIPASSAFRSSVLARSENAWFKPLGQSLVANPDAAWKFRTASGGFAVIRVSEIALGQTGLGSFTLEYRLQQGNTLGELKSLTVTPGSSGNPTRISLADGGSTLAGGCAWDLSIDEEFSVEVNDAGTCLAGAYPLLESESFETVAQASGAPQYAGYLSVLSSPIANSVSAEDSPPFIYGLDPSSPHRLLPSYNIYLLRRGNAVWKVQFIGYYNPVGGASAYPTLRVAKIR
jgi:hypothetical protein